MKRFKYIFVFISFFVMACCISQPLVAQTESQQDTVLIQEAGSDSLLLQRIDSLLNERFSRFDSLAQQLKDETANIDSVAEEAADNTQETLAQLEEMISWPKVALIIFFFILTYYFTVFSAKVLDNFSERASRYRLRIKRMIPIIRVIAWTLAVYIAIAGIIQPPYATVITVMASIGIAIGLASQDVLKNLFGGIMLIMDRPFQVGDKIQFADHYGEVLQIGLRSSRIVTPGDSVVTIPNGELIRTAVSNANSGALDCMVITNIYLPAECPVDEVKAIAYKAVISSRFVYLRKPVSITMENEMHQRRFVLKVNVKAYVLDIRYEFPFQTDVTDLILTELKKKGFIRDELPASK